MWVPWRLSEGPEYDESRKQIDAATPRLEENLNAARHALRRDPAGWSVPFLDDRDDLRIFRTQDFQAGYELVIFFRMDARAQACELKWVEQRPLETDEEPDEGPKGVW